MRWRGPLGGWPRDPPSLVGSVPRAEEGKFRTHLKLPWTSIVNRRCAVLTHHDSRNQCKGGVDISMYHASRIVILIPEEPTCSKKSSS